MMRRIALLLLTLAAATLALGVFARRDALRLQWECYQVTSAATYESFQQRMQQFEVASSDYNRTRALVSRWRTGNDRFDGFLARFLYDGQCSEHLREVFSRELNWRENLLADWAAQWRSLKPDPNERIGSIRRYLQTLSTAQPPRALTWRDVLDFQAVLESRGHGELARRVTPDNWKGRFQRWQTVDPVW